MYLTDILIRNVGPISDLDISLGFTSSGLPKPIAFVGTNGSGKTIVEATIADALFTMATPHFQDIVPQQGLGHAYFKLCGAINQRVGTSFGLSILSFQHGGKKASYFDKTGQLSHQAIGATINTRFPGVTWPDAGNHKACNGFEETKVQEIFTQSALCFFPSSRRETPHWLNTEAVQGYRDQEPTLRDSNRFTGRLGKPLFVERSREQNKQWILDVLFDSRTEIEIAEGKVRTAQYDNLNDRLLLTIAKNNINTILQTVLGIPDARLHTNYRGRGSRLSIANGPNVIIPSLDHLSHGQSLLFNMFCTIARYADVYDLSKGHQLEQIEGIVIIDEVDAHLHTELQFTSLPKLIKLFPKVQFIVSTHAPMFLLGMENEFGADGISIYELPVGSPISTERFSEFERSLEYYRQTKSFENTVNQKLLNSTRPTVLVEGDTDRDYLIRCLELLGRNDLSSALNIDWVGNNVSGAAQGGGSGSLDTVAKAFRPNIGLLQKKLLLLYDCDTSKPTETIGNKLFIRRIPQNPRNTKFTRGIENLLPESMVRTEFYDVRTDSKYGGRVETLNKRKLCNWAIDQADASLFTEFSSVIQILEEFAHE